jgi:hypothetical protein
MDILLSMLTHPVLIHLARLLSPRAWLIISILSLVVALSSALVLAVSAGARIDGPLGSVYDRVELFVRDTIRLTFKTDRHSAMPSESVFMAPLGILDERKKFNWLVTEGGTVALTLAKQTSMPPTKTPPRLLDPDWQPPFSGV